MTKRIDIPTFDSSLAGEMLAELSPRQLVALYESLSPAELRKINDDWSLWAQPHQRLPPLPEPAARKSLRDLLAERKGKKKIRPWRRIVRRGGRGSGKTHGSAKNVHEIARDRDLIGQGEIGIIHTTYRNARFGAVEGPSGLLATAPSDFRPLWEPGHGRLTWPNGVIGRIFSADEPNNLRNNNWSVVWGEEVDFWPNVTRTWWEVVEPALRLGVAVAILTSTPQNRAKGEDRDFLVKLEALDDTIVQRASMLDNPFLDRKARRALINLYGLVRDETSGKWTATTKRGLQELFGEFVNTNEGALWERALIDTLRVRMYPDLRRVCVSIDPAGSTHKKSNKTAINVSGIGDDGHAYVLVSRSGLWKPHQWAEIACRLYDDYEADEIVGETNFGGDMVESTIRAHRRDVRFTPVHASRGKVLRAGPVATLYENLRVHHVGVFHELENQQCEWEPGDESPDELDALVHALTHLQLRVQTSPGTEIYL